jgi:hypothetical protein
LDGRSQSARDTPKEDNHVSGGALDGRKRIPQHGSDIGLTDEKRAALRSEQTVGLVYGSKYLFAGWTCYVALIWSLKACMLFRNRLAYGFVPHLFFLEVH